MKTTIVTLACLLVAPMAFAQTHAKRESHTKNVTEQPITVTGKTTVTSEGGSAATYQPSKTLVINKDTPGWYVLNGSGHVMDKNGDVIRTKIRPGMHVRVVYVSTGGSRTIDHVVVD